MADGTAPEDDTADPVRPGHLVVDLQRRPVGVSGEAARFGWRLPATVPQQRAHQIQISTEPDRFTGAALAWDSGRRDGSASAAVPHDRLGLEGSRQHWWRVRVWSTDAPEPTSWSVPAGFTTAVRAPWPAEAVWARSAARPGPGEALPRWALIRHEVEVPAGEVVAAFVEAVGDSPEGARQYVYRLWCNAEPVGRGSVRPVAGEVRYHTHDVTTRVRPGAVNALAALCWAEQGRRFAARLVVAYADGRRFTVATSDRWRGLDGSAVLPGEDLLEGGWYRAPREHWYAPVLPVGWTEPGFDDSGWPTVLPRPAVTHPLPAVASIEQTLQPPASVRATGPGRWLVDVGRLVVGGLRLQVDAGGEQQVRVVLGEELEAGRPRCPLRGGNRYDETWTLRAGRTELEHWGYRGFRWAELTASGDVDLSGAVTVVRLGSSDLGTEAAFDCSEPDLVRVWQLCRDTVETTALDLYTDTPTRERGPYEGDQWVNQRGQYALGGGYALARYSQRFLTHRPTWPVEYRLLAVLCAWEDYLVTGDDRHLAEGYPLLGGRSLDRWVDDRGLVAKPPDQPAGEPGPGERVRDLVDWPPSERDGYRLTDVNTVVNAFQWAAWGGLARIARVLGLPGDADRWDGLAGRLRAGIEQHLLDRDGARFRDGLGVGHSAQHATAVPVALGLVPSGLGPALGETLAGQGVRVSIYAAQLLLDALYATGQDAAALRVMTDRGRPGWLDVMDRLGATLTPEAWDPERKPNTSFCHAWGTAPLNVVARHLVGVTVLAPGASHVRIRPRPGTLTWFRARVPTVRGPVEVSWDVRAGTAGCVVDLPGNMTAELDLAAVGSLVPSVAGAGEGLDAEPADGRWRWSPLPSGRTTVRFDRVGSRQT